MKRPLKIPDIISPKNLPQVPQGPHESMILCSNYRRYKNIARSFLRRNKKRYFIFVGAYIALNCLQFSIIPKPISAAILVGVVALMYWWIFNESRYQLGPTAIQTGKEGLRFHWAHYGLGYSSPWIDWSLIEFAESKDIKRFLLYGFEDCESIQFSVKMWAAPSDVRWFLRMARLYGLTRGFKQRGSINIRIEKGTIIHENDVARLIGALYNFLPEDYLDPNLKNLVSKEEDTSFTTLWLEQMDQTHTGVIGKAIEPGSVIGKGKYVVQQVLAAGGHAVTYLGSELVDGTAEFAGHNAANAAAINAETNSVTNATASEADTLIAASESNGRKPDRVALKEIVIPVAGGREIYERALKNVMREAELLKKLDNPQIVKCRDFFVENGKAYLVLDYIEGQSLRKLVNEIGPLDENAVIDLTRQMCEILQYLHSLKPPIIHRDFTPDNLILRPDKSLVLIDFNVAEQRESFETATVVGKHAYIPPEQFRGQATTHSDIYALGCCAFWLLTGQDPEPISVSHPTTLKPQISSDLDTLIAKATQMQSNDRFQSVGDMLAQEILSAERLKS